MSLYQDNYMTYGGADFAVVIIAMAILFVVVWILCTLELTKSQKYRKFLADMYVAGKIRQYATKDNLDLATEFESFKNWRKKGRIMYESLDNTVEIELQERIASDTIGEVKPF